jgi:hypothetical protein
LSGTAYKASPEREHVLTTEEAALRHSARIDALGGRFALDSPRRGRTRISIELPVEPTAAP